MTKFWLLLILFLLPTVLIAQTLSISSDSSRASMLPGTTTSISFLLENISSETATYQINAISEHPDILAMLQARPYTLKAGERSVLLVPIRIAKEAQQGTYALTLQIKNVQNGTEYNYTTPFKIAQNKSISLVAIEIPEFVRSGENIITTFLLKNSGNTTEELIMDAGKDIALSDSIVTLAAGHSKIITLTKPTNPDLGQNEYQNLRLTVFNPASPEDRQIAYASTKLIAAKPVEDDLFHRLPITASITYTGMENFGAYGGGLQGRIYGKGSLDKANIHKVEFSGISKNPVAFNAFSPYEEYYINYQNENLYIHLGDKSYSSSYLTEFARYGRGAEVRYNYGKVSLGGFYNRPRFFSDIQHEYNVYTTAKVAKQSELTAGFLYKTPRSGEQQFGSLPLDSDAKLPYVKGKFQITKNINIAGEYAYSKTKALEGNAYMLQTQFNLKKLNANVSYLHASPVFAGYFTNTKMWNGYAQYRFSSKWNFFFNFTQDAQNFRRDTLFFAAPYRQLLMGGLQYNYRSNGFAMLSGGSQTYQDRLEQKRFDYMEQFIRLSLFQNIGIFQLNLESQFGKTTNYLTQFNGNSSFYAANLSFQKFRTSFYLFASYAITSRYQLRNDKQMFYGARIVSNWSAKTRLSLSYQNNFMPEEYYKDRNFFELLFRQDIMKHSSIDISGRYTVQRGDINKGVIFSIRYSLRINAPVQKTASYTTLYGNVSNLGVSKTEGVRLMLGNNVAITDKEGNYVFKNVIPSEQILEIDRTSLELEDITNVVLPVSLPLHAKDNEFNFGLTSAGTIKGEVKLLSNAADENTVGQSALVALVKPKSESVILEASNQEQTYRKIVFIGDDFDFTYLRPGEWKVKIYRNGLDKRYKIAVDEFDVTLNAGKTAFISIPINKQQNSIKFQEGTIKVGSNETKKK